MLHAREDYNKRIQDNENKIPEDEPVFLVRAQDPSMISILETWIWRSRKLHVDDEMIKLVEDHKEKVIKWQKEKKIKIPDLPK